MIRDEELNRLTKYAQGMGVSVRFKPYVRGSKVEAEWAMDGSEITIYTPSGRSKLDKVLSLIHELGHHKSWIVNGRETDPKMEADVTAEENCEASRAARKRLLDMEIRDSEYWEDIYRDTNCQFNIEKLRKQREFDVWSYEVIYNIGRDPTKKEKIAKRKELRKKYGC